MPKLAIALLVLILTACAASATPPPPQPTNSPPPASPTAPAVATSPTPSPTATPSPTPSPTPDPAAVKSTAAAAYLAAVTAYNKASDKLYKAYPATFTSVAQARRFYTASAKITGAFLKAVRAITFPPDTVADAHTLVIKDSATQALEIQASGARSWADLGSVDSDLTPAYRAGRAASNVIRGDLGLPPVPA